MASDSEIPGDITSLLQRWSGGDTAALDDLVEIAYKELRGIAGEYLRQGNPPKYVASHRIGQRTLHAPGEAA